MKRKIISTFIITLMISVSFSISVSAGSEENPEIIDEQEDDVQDYLDIISAWFFEKEEEPDYLYTALKLNNVDITKTKQHLLVKWDYNGVPCAAGLFLGYDEDWWFSYQAGYGHGFWFQEHYEQVEGEFDEETGIIICKIPKNLINDPAKGDVLTNTRASAFQRFGFLGSLGFDRWFIQSLIYLVTGKSVFDHAPNEDYGREYVIQY